MRAVRIHMHGLARGIWDHSIQIQFIQPTRTWAPLSPTHPECDMIEKLHERTIRSRFPCRQSLHDLSEEPLKTFGITDEDFEISNKIESFLKKEFKKKQLVYPSDMAIKLNIDYEKVRKSIDKMISEGKLELANR